MDDVQSPNKLNDKLLCLFNINAYFLSTNIENLEIILDSTQICFDVIAVTEIRIVKYKFPVISRYINLTNYGYEYCLTESPAGGTLSYTGNHRLLNKSRNDLCIYKTAKLDSRFTELINTNTEADLGLLHHPRWSAL